MQVRQACCMDSQTLLQCGKIHALNSLLGNRRIRAGIPGVILRVS